MDGFVLSMLIPVLEIGALTLPALSVQVPGPAVWAVPYALSVTGAVQKSIVDRASAPVKVTVTSVLFQPLTFASGNWAAEAVGAVLSSLILTDPELVPPALVAVQVKVVPEVSVVWVTVTHPLLEEIEDSGSVTDQVMVGLLLFQPAALGTGETLAEITGGVLSAIRLKVADATR